MRSTILPNKNKIIEIAMQSLYNISTNNINYEGVSKSNLWNPLAIFN